MNRQNLMKNFTASMILLLLLTSCSGVSPNADRRTPPLNQKFLNCTEDSDNDDCIDPSKTIEQTSRTLSKNQNKNIGIFDNFFSSSYGANEKNKRVPAKNHDIKQNNSENKADSSMVDQVFDKKEPKELGIQNESAIENQLESSKHSNIKTAKPANVKDENAHKKADNKVNNQVQNTKTVTPPVVTAPAPAVVSVPTSNPTPTAPTLAAPVPVTPSSKDPVSVPAPVVSPSKDPVNPVSVGVPVPVVASPILKDSGDSSAPAPAKINNGPVDLNAPSLAAPVSIKPSVVEPASSGDNNKGMTGTTTPAVVNTPVSNITPAGVNKVDNMNIPAMPAPSNIPAPALAPVPASDTTLKDIKKPDSPNTMDSSPPAKAKLPDEMKITPTDQPPKLIAPTVPAVPSAANVRSVLRAQEATSSTQISKSEPNFHIPSPNVVRPKDITTGAVGDFYEKNEEDITLVREDKKKLDHAQSKKMQLIATNNKKQQHSVLSEEKDQSEQQNSWKDRIFGVKNKITNYFSSVKSKVESIIKNR